MTEFKVGDRVRARETSEGNEIEKGDLGTVLDVSGRMLDVRLDRLGYGLNIYARRFDRVVAESVTDFEILVDSHLETIQEMMVSRHKKYGPGNIAEFGELGLLVRLSDKMARLKNNQEDFSDESVDDTVDDIIGYALIWKLWRAGDWPS